MNLQLTEVERAVHNNRLKALFQEMELADSVKQYTLLLQASNIAFFIGEKDEALSYLLQASLIENSYEVNIALFYHYSLRKQWEEARSALLKAQKKHYTQMEIFTWEQFDSWLEEVSLPEELSLLLSELRSNTTKIPPTLPSYSFQEILQEDPVHAAQIFQKWKTDSGLPSKYPELSNLSIHQWEEEFPNREESIKEKESLMNQNITLSFQEFIELGKMYLLEDEYEKAAECFSSAKEIYTSKLS